MLIETCDLLRPSLKTKLQSAGLLYLQDLLPWASNGELPPPSWGLSLNATEREELRWAAQAATATAAAAASPASNSSSLTGVGGPLIRSLAQLQTEAVRRQREGHLAFTATTFSATLDRLLGGGVRLGGLTEISGAPGTGKTQLLLQLAVSCVLPRAFGGLQGSCLLIDTEGSFVRERLVQIARAAIALVRVITASMPEPKREAGSEVPAPGPLRSSSTSSSSTASASASGSSSSALLLSGTSPDRVSDCTEAHANRPSTQGKTSAPAQPRHPGLESPSLLTFSPSHVDAARLPGSRRDQEGTTEKPPPAAPVAQAKSKTAVESETAKSARDFTLASVLERIYVVPVYGGLLEFLAILHALPAWFEAQVSSGGVPFGMVVIDSIAAPFRGPEEPTRDPPSSPGSPFASVGGGASAWERARLIFTCGERLQQYATHYHLAVVVSNQLTRRPWAPPLASFSAFPSTSCSFSPFSLAGGGAAGSSRGRDVLWGGGSRPYKPSSTSLFTSNNPINANTTSWQSILVPALGDSWACHPHTRLLLAHHHYRLPGQAEDTRRAGHFRSCPEAIVIREEGDGNPNTTDNNINSDSKKQCNVIQHRVARILKTSFGPAPVEGCFVISRKGIRDGPRAF